MNSLELVELSSINKISLVQVSSCRSLLDLEEEQKMIPTGPRGRTV